MAETKNDVGLAANPAATYPDEFPEAPPAGYQDAKDSAEVQSAKEATMVGATLSRLSKQEIDTIYRVLAPLTKKMGWYASRYWSMQEKIRWYKGEHARLIKKCREYEQRLNIASELCETASPASKATETR